MALQAVLCPAYFYKAKNVTFDWPAVWDALPFLLEGTKMTIRITLLGLIGGTAIGFLTGVVTTYVKVPVTWKTTLIAVLALILLYALARAASFVAGHYLQAVPEWGWRLLQAAVAVLVVSVMETASSVALDATSDHARWRTKPWAGFEASVG